MTAYAVAGQQSRGWNPVPLFLLALLITASAVVLGNNVRTGQKDTEGTMALAKVVDWDALKNHRHSLENHETVIVRCIPDIFKTLGALRAWISERPTFPSGRPIMPSVAFVYPVGRAFRELAEKGAMGDCAAVTPQVIKREFNRDFSFNDLLAVAVFGRDVDKSGDFDFKISNLYFVYDEQSWRCRWYYTHQWFPPPDRYFPCAHLGP